MSDVRWTGIVDQGVVTTPSGGLLYHFTETFTGARDPSIYVSSGVVGPSRSGRKHPTRSVDPVRVFGSLLARGITFKVAYRTKDEGASSLAVRALRARDHGAAATLARPFVVHNRRRFTDVADLKRVLVQCALRRVSPVPLPVERWCYFVDDRRVDLRGVDSARRLVDASARADPSSGGGRVPLLCLLPCVRADFVDVPLDGDGLPGGARADDGGPVSIWLCAVCHTACSVHGDVSGRWPAWAEGGPLFCRFSHCACVGRLASPHADVVPFGGRAVVRGPVSRADVGRLLPANWCSTEEASRATLATIHASHTQLWRDAVRYIAPFRCGLFVTRPELAVVHHADFIVRGVPVGDTSSPRYDPQRVVAYGLLSLCDEAASDAAEQARAMGYSLRGDDGVKLVHSGQARVAMDISLFVNNPQARNTSRLPALRPLDYLRIAVVGLRGLIAARGKDGCAPQPSGYAYADYELERAASVTQVLPRMTPAADVRVIARSSVVANGDVPQPNKLTARLAWERPLLAYCDQASARTLVDSMIRADAHRSHVDDWHDSLPVPYWFMPSGGDGEASYETVRYATGSIQPAVLEIAGGAVAEARRIVRAHSDTSLHVDWPPCPADRSDGTSFAFCVWARRHDEGYWRLYQGQGRAAKLVALAAARDLRASCREGPTRALCAAMRATAVWELTASIRERGVYGAPFLPPAVNAGAFPASAVEWCLEHGVDLRMESEPGWARV